MTLLMRDQENVEKGIKQGHHFTSCQKQRRMKKKNFT